MKETKQLSQEEQILIQRCIDKNEEAWRELNNLCKSIIKNLEKDKGFEKLLKGANLEGEDLVQDIITKFLKKIKEYKIKKSLSGYIIRMAWNSLKEKYRDDHSKRFTYIDDIKHDEKIIASSPNIEYEKEIPTKIRDGIDKSIEYIKELYKLKKRIRSIYNKYEYVFRVSDSLLETKKKFNNIFGHISAELEEKISKYKLSSLIDFKNILNLEEKDFKIWAHKKLYDFSLDIDQKILNIFVLEEVKPIWLSPFGKLYFSGLSQNLPIKFSRNLIKMKIMPPRLMYDIWISVNELRKGKYTDPYKMGLIFAYYKRETKGTEKEFLLKSIPDDTTKLSTKIDNFRKYKSRMPANEKFYRKLVDFIYEGSFR